MVSSLGSHLEQWQESYAVEIVLNVYIKTESISVFVFLKFHLSVNGLLGYLIALELISVCGINVEFCFFKCRSWLTLYLEGCLKHKNSQFKRLYVVYDVSFENK